MAGAFIERAVDYLKQTDGVPSMGHAFLVYQTAHRAIETIEGEDIDGGIIRVTFVGRP